VDASAPDAASQVQAVRDVLAQLGLGDRAELLVYNKMDRPVDADRFVLLRQTCGQGVAVSALTGQGLEDLRAVMRRFLAAETSGLRVTMSPANGRLQAWLNQRAEVLNREFSAERVTFEVRIRRTYLGEIERLGGRLEPGDPASETSP
jgi:GTP-binding protein HflX